jgi:oligogalacturonide lyase
MASRMLVACTVLCCSLVSAAQNAALPPKTWVDKDTGHRIWRLSDEPNSGAFYFNVNAYTPDGKRMFYTTHEGIRVLDLASRHSKLLVANPARPEGEPRGPWGGVHTLVAGHTTPSIFYTLADAKTHTVSVYKADADTGKTRKLADLPPGHGIVSVNADETLAAGTYIEGGDPNQGFGPPPADDKGAPRPGDDKPHFQPFNKGAMMEARLKSHLPLVLFTLRLEPGPNGEKPGEEKILLHSTDWVNHLLFSPTNPELLMYCHEGPWQKVDRIWTIRTDGTGNRLLHQRTMAMEIAGHEFWGLDGETVWYDWQYPKGEDFFVAGYNLKTGERTAYHLQRNEWSIHFNLTQDLDLFTGDGGDPGQVAKAPDGEWIELFHPERIKVSDDTLNAPGFWQPGVFRSERLINMAHHNYRQEPNVRFSPDKKLVIFTSNMFGPSYILAAEVAKAVNPKPGEVVSTPELARKYNPVEPTPTH